MKADLLALADAISQSIKAYCEVQMDAKIAARMDAMRAHFADADAITKSVLEQVTSVLDAIPVPKDGEDADPECIAAEVQKAVDAIPRPQDGKDADAEEITKTLLARIDERIDAIELPQDGKDGKDADPEVIKAEIAKAVAEIPRPKDGASVDIEVVRAMVKGEIAELSKEISSGRDGRDGEPGRDAFAIDVLPDVNLARSYQRGTWAQRDGGLWMARSATDGENGWICIADGVKALEVIPNPDDPRVITVRTIRSSGKSDDTLLQIPMVIDKGVFREGEAYQGGDGVTWARHYWIARRETTAKPEPGSDWRLAVKSGRDGKDGKGS